MGTVINVTKPRRLLLGLTLVCSSLTSAQKPQLPIIDMHLHTYPWFLTEEGEEPMSWKQGWEKTREAMGHSNIVLGLASGPMEAVQVWRESAPSDVIAGIMFPCDGGLVPNSKGRKCFDGGESYPDLGWLRQEIESGRIGFLGEITSQYSGLPPNHQSLEPYYELAEELDIPVAIHIGPGPPGAPYGNDIYAEAWCGSVPCAPNYRASQTHPFLLEGVLIRHPRLRVFVMHAGWPMLEEMIHLMYSYPQVYVDIAVLTFEEVTPRKTFHAYVNALVDHGYGKRILWGTDTDFANIKRAIEAIESADFLTEEQKRDILYDNAARFLKLSEEQISAHHGH